MGKIAPVSAKYIIHAKIVADGIVEKPDVIGAVFGQTEGLLGTELELRELQKSGRIGRIEVTLDTKAGKTEGTIVIPSSLDMAETAVVAASMETINRIGPCNAKIEIEDIEDVRVSKRQYVIDRAKSLLRGMIEHGPESAELMEEIKKAVRALEIQEYGPERLPAGPGIDEAEEIIIVEGRADVINLLKNGFKNVIAINGTSIPKTIIDLTHRKTSTIFVDGDRGGDLIIKEALTYGDIDFVCKAPAGKEVEELTKKEIHKSIRARIPVDQYKEEHPLNGTSERQSKHQHQQQRQQNYQQRQQHRQQQRPQRVSNELSSQFRKMLEELIGTRGAYLLDKNLKILGKVPSKEIKNTIKNLPDVAVIIMDDDATGDLIHLADNMGIEYIVAMRVLGRGRNVKLLTAKDLGF